MMNAVLRTIANLGATGGLPASARAGELPGAPRRVRAFAGEGLRIVCLGFAIMQLAPSALAQTDDENRQAEAVTSSQKSPAQVPVEEARLGTGVFRDGLKRRGLNELLELHVRDFPATNPTAVLLMAREVKLADFASSSKSNHERRVAIAEANRILQQLIDDFPNDARRLDWQYALANSLLYDQAAFHATNLLVGLSSADDRDELKKTAAHALSVTRAMSKAISEEYGRIDRLPVDQFDELERTGHLDTLDKYAPAVDYLLVWSLFYDVLGRRVDDIEAAGKLNEILLTFAAKPALIETPHERSHIQVQTLLLAGMAHRRLNDQAQARTFLDRVRGELDRIVDARERQRVQWVVPIAGIETVANDRDDQRFGEAFAGIQRLRDSSAAKQVDGFMLRVACAMLQRSCYRAQAATARKTGHAEEASKFEQQSLYALVDFAAGEAEGRDRIYASVYRSLVADADVEKLDPFERCAWIWGSLHEADSAGQAEATKLIEAAIVVGEPLVQHAGDMPKIAPEALYLLGNAYYKRGDLEAAAKQFLRVVTDFPKSDRVLRAAGLAAQISADTLSRDPESPDRRSLYSKALKTLVSNYPHSEEARYWQFHYAALLMDEGEYEQAARIYGSIGEDHPRRIEALFRRIEVLARMMQSSENQGSTKSASETLDQMRDSLRLFEASARTRLEDSQEVERRPALLHLIAEAGLMVAEWESRPAVGQPASALQRLEGFESTFPSESGMMGRVWKTRFAAYERLGRTEDVTRALAALTQSDAKQSGTMLQALYVEYAADAERLRRESPDQAASKFATTVILAEQLVQWAVDNPSLANADTSQALRIQLAESCLAAGRFQRALELFENAAADAGQTASSGEAEPRVSFGWAESHFQMKNYATALPAFNRLAMRLPQTDPLRWRSLLRDLQCRTLLKQPAAGILKVIDQQRRLFPELGGTALAAEFAIIEHENQSRAGQ